MSLIGCHERASRRAITRRRRYGLRRDLQARLTELEPEAAQTPPEPPPLPSPRPWVDPEVIWEVVERAGARRHYRAVSIFLALIRRQESVYPLEG